MCSSPIVIGENMKKEIKKPNYPRAIENLLATPEGKKLLAESMVNPVRGSTPSPFELIGASSSPYEECEQHKEPQLTLEELKAIVKEELEGALKESLEKLFKESADK